MADTAAGDELVAVGRDRPARAASAATTFVEPWTDDPDERFAAGAVLRTEPAERRAADGRRVVARAGGKLVVHFDGGRRPRRRRGAARQRGCWCRPAARPPLDDPDDFYDTDLIGLAARTRRRRASSVRCATSLHAGGADYLVLDHRRTGGARAVRPRDRARRSTSPGGAVVVDPPDGLFDL